MKFILRLIRSPFEILEVLRSIDARLKNLESCVGHNDRSCGARKYIITGHWND